MHLAACSHQQQVEREMVASVLVVSCACIGCACLFLLLDIAVDLGCVACVLVFSCDCYQSQVQRDIIAPATSHRFSGIW